MGYLNTQVVEVDAILTKRGRELLSKGTEFFKITQFALADDEIDYRLWNPNHTLGSNYYGEVIENLPILEASPDQNQMLKFKLLTLKRNTTRIPVVGIDGNRSVVLQAGQVYSMVPKTYNFPDGNASFGYTAILADSDVCDLRVAPGGEINIPGLTATPFLVTEGTEESIAVIGKKFEVVAKSLFISDKKTTVTIIGNETGGRISITITVKKATVATFEAAGNAGN